MDAPILLDMVGDMCTCRCDLQSMFVSDDTSNQPGIGWNRCILPSSLVCLGPCMCTYVTALRGSFVFWVGRCLPVLLDASFATAANAEPVISHPLNLDVVGMM